MPPLYSPLKGGGRINKHQRFLPAASTLPLWRPGP
jgi:hypothetical protein